MLENNSQTIYSTCASQQYTMTTTAAAAASPKRKGGGGTGRPTGAYPPAEISFVSPSLHLKELERDIIQLKLELAESKTLNAHIKKTERRRNE